MKKLTATDIINIINEGNKQDTESYSMYLKMVEILTPFDGKKITRRMQTAVQAAMPQERVTYRDDYNHYSIVIWDKPTNREKYSFLIGYKDDPTFSLERFADYSGGYNKGALERNEKRRENIKEVVKVSAAINNYIMATLALNKVLLYHDFPEYHRILKMAEIDKQVIKGY